MEKQKKNYQCEIKMNFLIFITTIIITRTWLYFTNLKSPVVIGFKLHHYMYGILLMINGYFIHPFISLVGIGLIADELPLIIRYGNKFHYKEYWSRYSIVGVIVSATLIGFRLLIA